MNALTFSKLTLEDLKQIVDLKPHVNPSEIDWLNVDQLELSPDEHAAVQSLQIKVGQSKPHLLNEATVWAKMIFPLLTLAEKAPVTAWAEVNLKAQYPQFTLEGVVDGVLGQAPLGYLETPYFVVVEAKKGIGSETPQFQLYGQLLAAAWLNWLYDHQDPQEIFGCYTIATTWTFCRAQVHGLTSDRPKLILEISEELSEKFEAERILTILKGIVLRKLATQPENSDSGVSPN
jgi:hypothetical protein